MNLPEMDPGRRAFPFFFRRRVFPDELCILILKSAFTVSTPDVSLKVRFKHE